MVGSGVGVAPFRAFLQHRATRGDSGRNWLFHGIRNPSEDELYGDEFAAWRDDGLLFTYDVCASRVPEGRQYVQHRMAEHGRELFTYLDEGAAKDVRSAIRAIATEALGSAASGEAFVERLQAERRYRQDVY
jgi:sulfite reductase (NADPH) flavoprotein alpha-component